MKKSVKFCYALVGILLLVLGIVCLFNPIAAANNITRMVGLLLIVAGVILMFQWVASRRYVPEPGLLFFSAFMQILLGLMLIFTTESILSIIAVILSFWILFEGVSIIMESIDFNQAGFERWWILLVTGIVATLTGLTGILKPNFITGMINTIISMGIILAGVGYFVKLAAINKFENYFVGKETPYKEIEDSEEEKEEVQ